jgi:FkbM family methyltransferase
MIEKFYCETESDKFIRENFFSNYEYEGVMVEVGGGHPEIYSTSKHWHLNRWRTIVFEPQPEFYQMHKISGNEAYNFAISDKSEVNKDFHIYSWAMGMGASALEPRQIAGEKVEVIKTTTLTLNEALTQIKAPCIDILNIDVEGWEMEVMKGFSPSQFGNPIICIENYVHNLEYQTYMENIGYKLIWNKSYNYLYQFIPSNPIKVEDTILKVVL